MGEITVILLLALIVLGPKKLPELAAGLGKIIKDIRKATADVKNEIQLDEHIRKPFEELRDAVTLPPEELKRRDQLKKEMEQARRKAEADLAALASTTEAAKTDANGQVTSASGTVAPAPGTLPLPGMPSAVPPPFPGAGSGGSGPHAGHPVPPPFPGAGPATGAPVSPPVAATGSGPHGAVPPPFHHNAAPAPHAGASGSGPHAAVPAGSPPHTVPTATATARERPSAKSMPVASAARPVRPPGAPVAAPVPSPKPHADKTVTTQFLSEADLIPPDAPPPLPPGVPAYTGKHAHPPTVPGDSAKTAAPAAPAAGESADAAARHAPGEGAPHIDNIGNVEDKKGDVG